VVIPEKVYQALDLLEGTHTIEGMAIAWCQRYQTLDVDIFLEVLTRLQEAGLLEYPEEDEATAGLLGVTGGRQGWSLVCYRASSEFGRRFVLRLAGRLAPVMARPLTVAALALLALIGLILWLPDAGQLSLLTLADSYWLGLVTLLFVGFLVSLVGAVGTVAAQLAGGLPTGSTSFGLVCGLPVVWVELVEADSLSPRRKAWLHLAGPLSEGAVGGLALLLAAGLPGTLGGQALLLGGTVALVRLFAALCPWADGSLTRAVASLGGVPEVRPLAQRLLTPRLWSVLGRPGNRAEAWAGPYAVVMMLWTGASLYLLRAVVIPQLNLLLADLLQPRPLPDVVAAAVMLVLLLALAFGTVTVLGLGALVTLGRWLVRHPVWSQPGRQLIALLVVVVALVAVLVRLQEAASAWTNPLAALLAAAGMVFAWIAALLVFLEHRGGRLATMSAPLGLAAITALLAVAAHGHYPPQTIKILGLTTSFLMGLFCLGWITTIWRHWSGYVGLVLLVVTYVLTLVADVTGSAQLMFLVAALAGLITFLWQIKTWLAPLWLLVFLALLLPLVQQIVIFVERVTVSDSPVVVFTVVALLLGAGLLQWALGHGVGRLVEHISRCAAPGDLAERLEATLTEAYGQIAGGPARAHLRLEPLPEAPTPHPPVPVLAGRVLPEERLRRLLGLMRADLGELVTRQLVAGACQLLPWEEHLQVVGELRLGEWLEPPPQLSRDAIEQLLAASVAFCDLSEDELAQLATQTRVRRWSEQEKLLAAGQPAQWLHLLLQGSAAVYAPDSPRDARPLALLAPGDTLGLEALSEGGLYPVQVVALEPLVTLSLHRDDLASLTLDTARSAFLSELLRQVRALRVTSVFHDLAEAQVAAFIARADRQVHEPGSTIVRQGDPGDRFYVLRSGRVAVIHEQDEQEKALAELKAGDCFGELALLLGVPRTASVVARNRVETLSLGTEDFLRLFPPQERGSHALYGLSLSRVLKLSDHVRLSEAL
jgi:CRP-like cAMP-binding protein